MKKLIVLTIVAIILAGAAVFIFTRDTARDTGEALEVSPYPTSPAEETPTPAPLVTQAFKTTVAYSDSGYSPSTVTVRKGDTVVFENKSSKMSWTASSGHPAHNAYPGSGIEMCGANTPVAIFDACRGYGPGESWEFKFDKQGTWKYHNHLQPNHAGTIVVE